MRNFNVLPIFLYSFTRWWLGFFICIAEGVFFSIQL